LIVSGKLGRVENHVEEQDVKKFAETVFHETSLFVGGFYDCGLL
jgi:hypothetical protein